MERRTMYFTANWQTFTADVTLDPAGSYCAPVFWA